MSNIYTRFTQRAIGYDITTEQIWNRIKDWYNLDVLEELATESESDFSSGEDYKSQKENNKEFMSNGNYITETPQYFYEDRNFWKKKIEFFLPWDEYGSMIIERAGEGVEEEYDDYKKDTESRDDDMDDISGKITSEESSDEFADARDNIDFGEDSALSSINENISSKDELSDSEKVSDQKAKTKADITTTTTTAPKKKTKDKKVNIIIKKGKTIKIV
ncbi:hypothetical protein BB559_003430 [Furculomyces boomerangus]|uniref:Uncharacterized protein n=2 Tax=Harpellales TaxID=61421 RepID=A0A2T9YLE9_9FUNG|nr:hypothetical protein BB559_003430 [Furculomyces boomerangus]PVZ99455.1 hypothetical protein BB558_004435 [Smittium angustum]